MMRFSPNDGIELSTTIRTLVEDYKNLQKYASTQTKPTITPNDLTDYMMRQEYLNELTVPHVFEVDWMLQHPIFSELGNNLKARSAFWSSTPAKVWMPNMNKFRAGLYVGYIHKVHKSHFEFELQKYTTSSDPAYTWLVPVNPRINRGYRTNDDEIAEVHESGQFPRDFFEFKDHWDEFNKFTRLIKVERLLTT